MREAGSRQDFIAGEDIVGWPVETLGGEEMRDESGIELLPKNICVDLSLVDGLETRGREVADEMEGGKWGMTLPEGLPAPMTPKR